jgi:hypothetical protein
MIEKKLVEKLQEVTGLSNRVFPLIAKQGQEVPFVVYDRTATNRDKTLTGFDGLVEVSFQLDIHEKTYSNLKTVSQNVITKLKSFEGQTWGTYKIQSCEIDNEIEDYFDDDDVKWYVSFIDFTIIYKEV